MFRFKRCQPPPLRCLQGKESPYTLFIRAVKTALGIAHIAQVTGLGIFTLLTSSGIRKRHNKLVVCGELPPDTLRIREDVPIELAADEYHSPAGVSRSDIWSFSGSTTAAFISPCLRPFQGHHAGPARSRRRSDFQAQHLYLVLPVYNTLPNHANRADLYLHHFPVSDQLGTNITRIHCIGASCQIYRNALQRSMTNCQQQAHVGCSLHNWVRTNNLCTSSLRCVHLAQPSKPG